MTTQQGGEFARLIEDESDQNRPLSWKGKKAPARGWGELGELGLSDLRDKNASRDHRTMTAERFKFRPLL